MPSDRYAGHPGRQSFSLGKDFCIQQATQIALYPLEEGPCEKKRSDVVDQLTEKLAELEDNHFEVFKQSVLHQNQKLKRLTARLERIERLGRPPVDTGLEACVADLKKRLSSLEELIGEKLPEVMEKIAELIAALAALEQSTSTSIQNVVINQSGQATDLSQILATLASIAVTLVTHDVSHTQHTSNIIEHEERIDTHDVAISDNLGVLDSAFD